MRDVHGYIFLGSSLRLVMQRMYRGFTGDAQPRMRHRYEMAFILRNSHYNALKQNLLYCLHIKKTTYMDYSSNI